MSTVGWWISLFFLALTGGCLSAWKRSLVPSRRVLRDLQTRLRSDQFALVEKRIRPHLSRKQLPEEALLLYLKALFGLRRFEEALHHLQNPASPKLHLEKGRLLLALHRYEEALSSLLEARCLLSTESKQLLLAEAYFGNGKIEACCETLWPHIETSTNGRLFALLGECFYSLKEHKRALHWYERASSFQFHDHQMLVHLAHCYRATDSFEKAETLFRKLLEENPEDALGVMGLGKCYQDRGQFQRALLVYQASPVWQEMHPDLLREAGVCALKTQKVSYALSYFNEVLERKGPSPSLLSYIGYCHESLGNYTQAESVYVQMVSLYPSHPNGYRALAWLYGVGKCTQITAEEGIGVAKMALQMHADPAAWEILSACEARGGNFRKAHKIQEKLSSECHDHTARRRRQSAMRTLRKQKPLAVEQVSRSLVA